MSQQERFSFPPQLQRYLSVSSSQGLKELLRAEIEISEIIFEEKFTYHVSMKNPKLLRAKCSKCSAFLSYRISIGEDTASFILKSYRIAHKHLNIRSKTKRSEVVQFLRKNKEYETNFYPLRLMAMKQLDISSQKFYRAVLEIEGGNSQMTFPILQSFLESKGEVRFDPFPLVAGYPNSLIFISSQMRQEYLINGRVVYLDFTYNLIQQMSITGQQWTAGFVTGLNAECQLKVFAITLCSGQTASNVYIILKNLFQMMGKQCETIVSDRGKGIIEGIKKLVREKQYDGHHLFDAFHIMKGIKTDSAISRHFHDLYKTTDVEQYTQVFDQAMNKAENEQGRKALRKFDSLSHQFCLPYIPKTFVGLGVSSSPAEKFNDQVKKIIPRQQGFCSVFLKLRKAAIKINANRQIKRKKIKVDFSFVEGLQGLADNLCERAFNFLMKQILKSIHISHLPRPLLHEQNYSLVCECGLKQKTGLPCSHLLRQVIRQGESIEKLIDPFWCKKSKIQQPASVQVQKRGLKRGRPCTTRRNRG